MGDPAMESEDLATPAPEMVFDEEIAQAIPWRPKQALPPTTDAQASLPHRPGATSDIPISTAFDIPDETEAGWLDNVLREQAKLQATRAFAPRRLSRGDGENRDIGYYRVWLDNESQRRSSPYFKSSWRGFTRLIHENQRGAGKDETAAFAAIDAARSAVTTLTMGQIVMRR